MTFDDFRGGYYPASNPSDITYSTVPTGYRRCEDVVGSFKTANYLDISGWRLSPGYMSGQESVWPVYGFNRMPYTNQPAPDILPGSDSGFLDAAAALTQVAAWTSPGKASVSLPNFLFELKDLPSTLQRAPTRKSKSGEVSRGDNSVAETNFAWDAAFSDIRKMLDFTKAFEKRLKELNDIYDKPFGLKRQRVVAEGHVRSTVYVAANSWICGVGVNRETHTLSRQWAALSWKPLFGALAEKPSNDEIRAKALASVHGWRANPKIVWDALPWSWFVDYFSNVGDLIEASSNSFEYFPDQCCVMTRTLTTIRDRIVVKHPDFIVTPARMVVDWKHRQPTSFGLRLINPLISGRQLVTLAGIAANWR